MMQIMLLTFDNTPACPALASFAGIRSAILNLPQVVRMLLEAKAWKSL